MTGNGQPLDSIRAILALLVGRDKDWGTRAIEGFAQLENPRLDALASGLDDADPSTRWWCLRLLVPSRDSRRLTWLSKAMQDPDGDVRMLAALALHDQSEPRAIPVLLDALDDELENIRDLAADTIGSLAQCATESFDVAVDPLIRRLRDPSLMVRQTAAFALEYIGDPRAADALVELLDDPDAYARARAALALTAIHDSRGIGALVAGAREESLGRDDCVAALYELTDTTAADMLMGLLGDAEPELRDAAVSALGKLREARAVPDLLRILKERGLSFQTAITSLGEIGDRRAVTPLLEVLANSDAETRRSAARALGGIGAPEAAPFLDALIRDEDHDVRRAIVRALPRVAGLRSADTLLVALDDARSCVRLDAVEELGRLPLDLERRGGHVQRALVRAFHDVDLDVRRAAVLAVR